MVGIERATRAMKFLCCVARVRTPLCCPRTFTLNDRNYKKIDCPFVKWQTIYDKDVSFSSASSAESTAIYFDHCILNAIPSAESIKKFIPNLTVVAVNNSKLSKITADDFKGFDCLRDLYIEYCEIEYLPGDVFKHTPDLEIVSFHSNKIKYIDEGILEPLRNLKILNLVNNVNIDAKYDILNNRGNVTLAQLKNEIKTKCSRTDLKKDEQQKEIKLLKTNDEVQKKEIAELKRKVEEISDKFVTLSSENEKSKKMCLDHEKKLETLSQQFQVIKQVSKNFTIKVKDNLFMVHKAVLIAHSPVLAKLIADNPEADNLELKDVSVTTFQEIFNFMSDGSPPSEEAKMVDLFEASCRFKIEALATITAELLKEKVNEVNALDVLVLCNKFENHDELKMMAFAEVQKKFQKP